jgi:hypothetical protein
MSKGTIGVIPLSPSTIKVAACPFALYCKVMKIPEDGRDPELSQYGKAAHSIYDMINRYNKTIDDAVIDSIISKGGIPHEMKWMRMLATNYIRDFPIDRVILSEQKLGLDINLKPCPFGSATYRGIIDTVLKDDAVNWMDAVTREITIMDHKAGWKLQKPECMQLEFYAWVFARNFPMSFDTLKLGMHFPRKNLIRIGKYIYTWDDIDKIERSFLATAKRIWESPLHGPAIPGSQCANCNWISRCPVPDNQKTEIYTERQAQELAGQIRVLDLRMKDMKRKLRSFIKRNNDAPVVLRDYNYAFGPMDQQTFEVDPHELLSKLDDHKDLIDHISVKEARELIGHESGIHVEEGIKSVYKGQGYEIPDEEEDFYEFKTR